MKRPSANSAKKPGRPWATKLRPEMKPEVVPDPRNPGRLLLPTPILVAEEIATLPRGSFATMSELRARLARRHDADRTCPLMTGIFFNIVAGATEDDLAAGRTPLAPYWRVVRDDGTLSPKTPDGPERQAEHLRKEGFDVQVSSRGWSVVRFPAPVREPRRARGRARRVADRT